MKTQILSILTSDTDNWMIAYENGKCFKLTKDLITHGQTEEICNQQSLGIDSFATLASIKSHAEKEFLIKNVIGTSVSQNIWIKSSDSAKDCVQSTFTSKYEMESGDVDCEVENCVLCEKSQTGSLKDLQQIILDSKKEVQEWTLVPFI